MRLIWHFGCVQWHDEFYFGHLYLHLWDRLFVPSYLRKSNMAPDHQLCSVKLYMICKQCQEIWLMCVLVWFCVLQSQAIVRTRQLAEQHCTEAIEAIRNFTGSAEREALIQITTDVLTRTKWRIFSLVFFHYHFWFSFCMYILHSWLCMWLLPFTIDCPLFYHFSPGTHAHTNSLESLMVTYCPVFYWIVFEQQLYCIRVPDRRHVLRLLSCLFAVLPAVWFGDMFSG